MLNDLGAQEQAMERADELASVPQQDDASAKQDRGRLHHAIMSLFA